MRMKVVLVALLATGMAVADVVTTKTGKIEGTVVSVDSPYVCVQPPSGAIRVLKLTDVVSMTVSDVARADSLKARLPGLSIMLGVPAPMDSSWLVAHKEQLGLNVGSVEDAGASLRSARTSYYYSVGMSAASIIITAVCNMIESDGRHYVDPTISIGIPAALDLASFISAITAWHRVGQAGDRLRRAAKGERK